MKRTLVTGVSGYVGAALAERLRADGHRVRGFARGADDYVVRPFVYEELVARMRAVLRRAGRSNHRCLAVRDIDIDIASRVVRVAGEPVQLSAKEFDLLVALAEDPERVFRKEELLRDVWGFRSMGRTRTLDSHASRLRRKLEPEPRQPRYLHNHRRSGYLLAWRNGESSET